MKTLKTRADGRREVFRFPLHVSQSCLGIEDEGERKEDVVDDGSQVVYLVEKQLFVLPLIYRGYFVCKTYY